MRRDTARWAYGMPTMQITVNLDAMIEREDFQVTDDTPSDQRVGTELYLNQLTEEGRLATFKKPDFQRETAAWSPQIVANFIKSVVDGDVIPAIIMWKSPRSGNIFVIDGAHRLSALIAWILDDYGDMDRSLRFFQNQIDQAQKDAAQVTRDSIKNSVGSYKDLNKYRRSPKDAPSEVDLKRSRAIANAPLYLQWVTGDARAAEASYIRINSTAVPINDTERELIDALPQTRGSSSKSSYASRYWPSILVYISAKSSRTNIFSCARHLQSVDKADR